MVNRALRRDLPRIVSKRMLEQTQENFRREEYGNDITPRRWKDRYGYTVRQLGRSRVGGWGNVEQYLNYRKLQYSGRLRQSIRAASGPGYAAIIAGAPYAAMHNEGRGGGRSFPMRKPPASSTPVILGRNPRKRQFMGVGRKDYDFVFKNAIKYLRRI